MFKDTVTLFNYHAASDSWYPSVITGVDFGAAIADNRTTQGIANEDTVQLLIQCGADKAVTTTAGKKQYMEPKEYAGCENPEEAVTFSPEYDFFYEGVWPDNHILDDDYIPIETVEGYLLAYRNPSDDDEDVSDVTDSDYDAGFYNDMNDEYDGVHRISSAAFYGLIPHFEIGGR